MNTSIIFPVDLFFERLTFERLDQLELDTVQKQPS